MGWMDASEYVMLEQAAKDRIEHATRFTTEHEFRFGTPQKKEAPRPSVSRSLTISPAPAAP
jgi:hypothetical protein